MKTLPAQLIKQLEGKIKRLDGRVKVASLKQSDQDALANQALTQALDARKIAAYRTIYLVVPRTEYLKNFVLDPAKKCFVGTMRIVLDGTEITRFRDIIPGQAIIAQRRVVSSDTGNSFSVFYVEAMDYSTGIATLQMISRVEAATVGQILLSKEFSRQSPIPSSNHRHPRFEVWHPNPDLLTVGWWLSPYYPIDYVLRAYNPKAIYGANVYIQNTEPSDPNSVWIDTNGIDLILS